MTYPFGAGWSRPAVATLTAVAREYDGDVPVSSNVSVYAVCGRAAPAIGAGAVTADGYSQ